MQYGEKALQALSLRGGKARQEDLARDVGLPGERLGAILAGLHHNGYLVRTFGPQGIDIVLTSDGTHWLSNRGTLSAAHPLRVQRQQPPQQRQQPAQPQPAPRPQAAAPAPAQPRPAAVEAQPAADGKRRILTMAKPKPDPVVQPAAAAPAPQPEPEPEPAAEAAPAPAAPEEAAEAEAKPRPRRRKAEPKKEVATDDGGFVTHIKGKPIY